MLWIFLIFIIAYLKNYNNNMISNNQNTVPQTIFPSNFNFEAFRIALADSESGSGSGTGNQINYSIINSIGATGAYQFMPTTIRQISGELNIAVPSQQDFISSPTLQDQFYYQYVNDILNYISSENLSLYLGQQIAGQKNQISTSINIYGMVGAAWLAGMGNLKKFLYNGYDPNDGYTYLSDYLAKFSLIFNSVA